VLVTEEPPRARLIYRFAPVDDEDPSSSAPKYRGRVFGGDNEDLSIPSDLRGLDLDKLGISVCAVHGTHFDSYTRFCDALEIPWAVITDRDNVDKDGISDGQKRAQRVLDRLGLTGSFSFPS
jgi:hypothetical protein